MSATAVDTIQSGSFRENGMIGLPALPHLLRFGAVDYTLANCRDENLMTFFPLTETVNTTRRARAICQQCPIREECLEDNLLVKHGVFGGMDAKARRALARERRLEC